MVTVVSGDSVCESSACSPNPCQFGSTCDLDNSRAGGYECICVDGYTGTNCEENEDECVDGVFRILLLY